MGYALRPDAGPPTKTGHDQFHLLVDGVKDYAIIMLDPKGRIVSWNEGARRLKGYEQTEIIGQSIERLYPPDALADGVPGRLLAQAAETGRCESDGWRLRKDGTRFFANVVLSALRDGSGKLVGFAKITRDITQQRAAEDALRISEGLLKRAQHLANMGSDIRDPKTGERKWSDECYKIFGVSRDFVPTADNVLRLVHPDDRHLVLAQRAQIAAGTCPGPIEYRIVRPNGQ